MAGTVNKHGRNLYQPKGLELCSTCGFWNNCLRKGEGPCDINARLHIRGFVQGDAPGLIHDLIGIGAAGWKTAIIGSHADKQCPGAIRVELRRVNIDYLKLRMKKEC